MSHPYLPIFAFISFAIALSLVALGIGKLISPSNDYAAKTVAYECGFPSFGDANFPFNIQYYRVAILFIIFDIETAFFIPWALSVRTLGIQALVVMIPFLLTLLVGFIYEWKRGALEWN